MPKRKGNLYKLMPSEGLVKMAIDGVLRKKPGKTNIGSVAFMLKNNKDYYARLAGELIETKTFKPSRLRIRTRIDAGSGKIRTIKAPRIFPDQVIHWCLMLVMIPTFMESMDDYCCASIKGRGPLYAKKYIEKKLDAERDPNVKRKYKYAMKLDIRKFFDNISRPKLIELLERRFKDRDLINLCSLIINSVPGDGLPLGFFTSQWFANFYLEKFDHHVREHILPKYNNDVYVRFMDDMFFLGSNKRHLQYIKKEISEYLVDLNLSIKDDYTIVNLHEGMIDYIGYQFGYNHTILRERTFRSVYLANKDIEKGKMTLAKIRSSTSYTGFLKHVDANTYVKQHVAYHVRDCKIIMKRLLAKKLTQDFATGKFKYMDAETRIRDLRQCQHGDDAVLIRYYPNENEARIVARTSYQFPDHDEYMEKLKREAEERQRAKEERAEIRKKNKKKKKRKHKPGTKYYPTSELVGITDPAEKKKIIDRYNFEIEWNEEIDRLNSLA